MQTEFQVVHTLNFVPEDVLKLVLRPLPASAGITGHMSPCLVLCGLGIEIRALCVLGKHPPTKLCHCSL